MTDTAQISIIVATRTNTTNAGGISTLLDAFEDTLHNPCNLEVIIRGDNDDSGFDSTIKAAQDKKYSFKIHFIKGNRGRGYEDLHIFHNEGLLAVSRQSRIVFSLPEDVTIALKHWDQALLSEFDKAHKGMGHKVFTMHQTPMPGVCDNFEEAIELCDSFPMYTVDWIQSVGGFGYCTGNDGWVQMTHHYLLRHYGLNIKHVLPKKIFIRHGDGRDSMTSKRWVNARLRIHDLLHDERMRKLLNRETQNIAALACKQMKDASQLNYTEMYDTINMACTRYGTPSILYKVYYNLINNGSAEFLKSVESDIEALAKPLLALKDNFVEACDENIERFASNISLKRLWKLFIRNGIIRPIYRMTLKPIFSCRRP